MSSATHAKRNKGLYIVTALLAAGIAVFYLFGQSGQGSAGIEHIGPAEAMQRLQADPHIVLVDVRTPAEYRSGHLAHSILVPLDQLEQMAGKALPDRNAHLLVYCHSGNRSSFAVNILNNMGYTNLMNMTGGIAAWSAQGLPVVLN